MNLTLPVELVNQILGYLGSRPYQEVFHLVQAVQNLSGAMHYIVKYISKVHNSDEPKYTSTLANMWLYRKRAYGLSGEFMRDLEAYRVHSGMHNSNLKMHQIDLFGEKLDVGTWRMVGFTAWGEIEDNRRKGVKRGLWHYNLRRVPEGCLKRYYGDAEDRHGGDCA